MINISRIFIPGLVLIAAALGQASTAQAAYGPIGNEVRISTTVADGDNRSAFSPTVTYNSQSREFLAVWESDGHTNPGQFEIFGQRISVDGGLIGSAFRISNVTEVGAGRDASSAAVTYNSQSNEYLVVWRADELATDNENEVFGQRVSAAGAEIGSDFRISNVGPDGSAARGATAPVIAYNLQANQYLVAWQGDTTAAGVLEIEGQRVSAAGAEVGSDFQISDVGAVGSDRDAFSPAAAYNSQANEFLVTWQADELATATESEIFGQRVSAAGVEIGSDDFRISTTGADGDANRDAGNPDVAYNPAANQYLVAWSADGLVVNNENEIFGRVLAAAGAGVTGDFRISTVGTDGDTDFGAEDPSIAYNSVQGEYLVTYEGEGTGTSSENEGFGQRVSAAGTEIGADFRVTHAGPDGDDTRDAFEPIVAYDPSKDRALLVWYADELQIDNEFEVYGSLIGEQPASPPPAPPKDTSVSLKLSAAKAQRALRTGAIVVRIGCDTEACSAQASADLNVPGASKRFKLAKVKRAIGAGQTATLKLKLTAKAKKAIKRALARKKTVRAKVKASVTDAAGNAASASASVRLKR